MRYLCWLLLVACATGCTQNLIPSEDEAQESEHIVNAQMLDQATEGYAPAPDIIDVATLSGQWSNVSLPHAPPKSFQIRSSATHSGLPATNVHWYRLQAHVASIHAPNYLYVPRWQSDGTLTVYANSKLIYRSHSNLQWNGWNQPLWLPLDDVIVRGAPTEIVVRIQHLADTGGAISSAYVGSMEHLYWRYWSREFFQIFLPQVSSATILALGLFAGFVWLKRRHETTYALFFALAVAVFVRNLHFFVGADRLPVSDAWFGWLTLNSLFWLLAVLHLFLLRVLGRKQSWMTRIWLGSAIAANVITMPLLSGFVDATIVMPWVSPLLLGIAVPSFAFTFHLAYRLRSREALLLSGWALFSVLVFGVHDSLEQSLLISIEHIYLSAYAGIGMFYGFAYVMFHRYIGAIRVAENAKDDLTRRLREREDELTISHRHLHEAELALEHQKTEMAEAAHREAENANLAKSKFLAAASHDLRQPIHSQGLLLDVLSRTELNTTQLDIVANIRTSSDATRDMLNTLLDFSRIEAGVVEPYSRPFHLQPLLSRIESEFAHMAMDKGLFYRARETHVTVHSDPALVELIVRNLVSNAIRYTEHGGVLVACRLRGDSVQLEVWDTGIGIDPSQQQDIFREFHQLGNPERDRRKGLGLGLAIANGLAQTLRHRLWLSSTPGHGSVFRLELPVARNAVITDEPESKLLAGKLKGARILVIDDDEAVRTSMSHLVQDWGCLCTAVESIEEALAAARSQAPDIVISDYRLREQRTGAEAIAALRAELGHQLPALLITGDTAPERLREARASNVPLLHKPVSPEQLHKNLVSQLAM
jgi:signal transduction histidine kinase